MCSERLQYAQSSTSSFILPETLPGKNDATFVALLTTLTPRTKGRRGRRGSDDAPERAVHLMWCSTLCYTAPYQELPTCVYITTENVHVFHVLAIRGADGMPTLRHATCIKLANIHQIVLGYRDAYIRVEEAFVGAMGTYTFLSGSASKNDLFLESLKLAYRRAAADPDHQEEPHVVVNGETDLKLKHVLNRMEGRTNAADVRVVLYMLVHAADVANVTHSLVVTDRYLYLLQEDYVLWPQPTFAVGPSLRPQFVIVQAFPVTARISGVHMYDSDTYCRDQETSISQTFCATNALAMQLTNFIGYGVRLTMDLGSQGVSKFDVRVPTSGMRDQFLGALTEVRSGQAGRSHARAKLRKKRAVDWRAKERHNVIARLQLKHALSDSNESTDNNSVDSVRLAHLSDDSTLPSSGGVCGSDGTPMRDSPTGESQNLVDSSLDEFVEASENPPDVVGAMPTEEATSDRSVYPTLELLHQLSACNENMRLLTPLSAPMLHLASMTGEETLNYFHSRIAQIGVDSDELRHVVWTAVTPYLAPAQEIPTCVMLSTRAVYFVSDTEPVCMASPPGWRSHSRNKSDSFGRVGRHRRWPPESHNATAGIIQRAADSAHRLVRAYHVLPLIELTQVHIGLFDQRFRLAGASAEAVFTCVTRDNNLTEQFMTELSSVLCSYQAAADKSPVSETEPDFYKMYGRRERCASDSAEATTQHAHVEFVYPREDSISDMSYLIAESAPGPTSSTITVSMYVMLYVVDSSGDVAMRPRSLVVADGLVCVAVEDCVSYPLPTFARCPPDRPRYEIADVRRLEYLRRIALTDHSSHNVSLVFADENDELQIDTGRRYYNSDDAGVDQQVAPVPDVTWRLVVQSLKDKERLVRLVSRQWKELHEGETLPIEVDNG